MGTTPSVDMIRKGLDDNKALNDILGKVTGGGTTGTPIIKTPVSAPPVRIEEREPEPTVDPQAIADSIMQARAVDPDPVIVPDEPVVQDTPESEPVIEETKPTSPESLLAKDKNDPKQKLVEQRKVIEEKSKEAKRLAEEKVELEKKLEAYTKGEIVPEFVAEKEAEINRLKRFEEIHSLKTSQGYVDKFVKPIESLKGKLYELAKEYEYENPEDLIEEALNLNNRRDINKFLEGHFDNLDGQQAKGWIEELQGISSKARDAELRAGDMLKDLSKEGELLRVQKKQEIATVLNTKANEAWIRAHNKIIKDNRVMELIPRKDDSKFNDEYVNPHLKAAAGEYGKFIAKISSKLAEPLEDDELEFLANTALLGHASATLSQRANAVTEKAQKIYETTQRTNSYFRPPVGSASTQGHTPAPAPVSTNERADKLLQTGMANARK